MKKGILNVVTYTLVFLAIQYFCLLAMPLFGVSTEAGKITGLGLIITMGVSSLIAIALYLLAHWAEVSPTYLRSRPWAVFFWSGIASLGAIIPSLWLQEQIPELPNFLEESFDMILRDRWGYVVIGLLAPVAEEIVFHGAVLRELLQMVSHRWTAIAISALVFALIHGNPAQMPHAFLIGLLLGWMYWRTGSILPGVVFHWVNNSVAYVGYNLYPDPSIKLVDLFGSQRSVAAAVAFSLLILVPALYQLYLRLRPASGQ